MLISYGDVCYTQDCPMAVWGVDVWPEYGMFVWHVMVICVDCFVGISYATIGLVFACF